MNPLPKFLITLEFGGRRRMLFGESLPAALRDELVKLLMAGVIHGKEGVGGGWGSPHQLPGTNERKESVSRSFSRSGEEGEGGAGDGDEEAETLQLASYLADALDDRRSLRWYQLVAATVPYEIVRHALTRALDFRRDEVRRSRAAYFTAIVKPYVSRSRLGT